MISRRSLLFAPAALAQVPERGAPEQETWIFDRLDRLGRHAVTVEGTPRVVETPLGKAVEFKGVPDALFVDAHPLAGAERFTWEVIFRPDADGGREQRFFHLQEDGSQTRLLFETRVEAGQWWLDSFAMSAGIGKALINPALRHPCGQWYAAAAVYDGREFRNYVNGQLQASGEVALRPQGPGRTSVGVRINKVDYFKGAIRLSRFTRRALTRSELLPPPAADVR
jgi:hypothetical protein